MPDQANAPAQARRANDVRLSTETRPRRSVQPVCSAISSSLVSCSEAVLPTATRPLGGIDACSQDDQPKTKNPHIENLRQRRTLCTRNQVPPCIPVSANRSGRWVALGRIHASVEVPRLEIALAINHGAVNRAREHQQAKPQNAGAHKCERLVHLLPDVAGSVTAAERRAQPRRATDARLKPRRSPGVGWRVWFDLISMSISPVEKVHSGDPTTKTGHHEPDQ